MASRTAADQNTPYAVPPSLHRDAERYEEQGREGVASNFRVQDRTPLYSAKEPLSFLVTSGAQSARVSERGLELKLLGKLKNRGLPPTFYDA